MAIVRAVRNLLDRMETLTAPLWQWCAAFASILFVRFLIESFSSPMPSFPAAPNTATLIHYILFFLAAFLSLALILRIFIPDVARTSKFLLFCLPIIWLAPILDLAYSHGIGSTLTYIYAGNAHDLWREFFTIGGGGVFSGGVTGGLRTEIMAIFIGAALYVAVKTGNIAKAVLAGLLSYCALFLLGALPDFVALAAAGHSFAPSGVASYLASVFLSSHLLANFVRPSAALSPILTIETSFNVGMSTILYFIDFVLVVAWTAVYRRELLAAFVKSLRLGRIAYYYSLLAMGAFVAFHSGTAAPFENWMDVLSFACLALAFLAAFAFATGVNDIADAGIDRMNGAARPLAMGAISKEETAQGSLFFFAWALTGAYLCGYWAFFTLFAAMAAYYVYSAPPLRLKRVPIIASFLVAVAGLATVMAGFFFVDARKLVVDFPVQLLLLLLVCLTLAINFKDVKGIEGDRAHDIWTLPVLLGETRGKIVVGALLAASFLAIPVILGSTALFLPSLIAAALGYFFVTARSYREWRVFALYFAYLGTAVLLLLR